MPRVVQVRVLVGPQFPAGAGAFASTYSSSFEVYLAAINALLPTTRVAGGPASAALEIAATTQDKTIRFALTAAARDALPDILRDQKRTALQSFFAVLDDRRGDAAWRQIYDSHRQLIGDPDVKDPDYTQGELTQVVRDRIAEVPAANLDRCREIAVQLLGYLSIPPFPEVNVNIAMARVNVCAYLNNADVPARVRTRLGDNLLDAMALSCAGAPNQTDNKQRLQNIGNLIGQNDIPADQRAGSRDFQASLAKLKTRLAGHIAGRGISAEMLDTPLTRGDTATVIGRAVRWLNESLIRESGAGTLYWVRDAATDPDRELRRLLHDLWERTLACLEPCRFQIAFYSDDAGNNISTEIPRQDLASPGAGAQLYPFPFLEVYRARKPATEAEQINHAMRTINTPASTFSMPLADIVDSELRFYNCGNSLYLICADNDADATRLVSDRTFPNTDPDGIANISPEAAGREAVKSAVQRIYGPSYVPQFNFVRTFHPLYLIQPSNWSTVAAPATANYTSQLVWRIPQGLGDGIARADPVNPDDYLWTFAGSLVRLKTAMRSAGIAEGIANRLDLATIARFLGLDVARHEDFRDSSWIDVIWMRRGSSFSGKERDSDGRYIYCNSPYLTNEHRTITATNDLLQNFRFRYLRRASDAAGDPRVIKPLPAIHRPARSDAIGDDDAPISIELAPPICFDPGIGSPVFAQSKQRRAALKNKGSFLQSGRALREDAGTVMDAIGHFASDNLDLKRDNDRLPASFFANRVLARNGLALADWRKLKLTNRDQLPTDQEWCHLKGHGDGGDERTGNFVSGSFHCNTEQLAIESAQRPFTQQRDRYILKSTAYLLNDDSLKLVAEKSYLGDDEKYAAHSYPDTVNVRPLAERNPEGTAAPIAAFIRYKIIDSLTNQKIFDYVFEGQSEFFDRNQYNILSATVRYLLDPPSFLTELAEYIPDADDAGDMGDDA